MLSVENMSAFLYSLFPVERMGFGQAELVNMAGEIMWI